MLHFITWLQSLTMFLHHLERFFIGMFLKLTIKVETGFFFFFLNIHYLNA